MSKHRNARLTIVAKLYREYLGLPNTKDEIIWHHQTGKENDIANLDTIEKIRDEATKYDCIPLTELEHENAHGNTLRHTWKPCNCTSVKSNVHVLDILFDEIMKKIDKSEFTELKLSEIRNIYLF